MVIIFADYALPFAELFYRSGIMVDNSFGDLRLIPGVGRVLAGELGSVGIFGCGDLVGADAEVLYEKLCDYKGMHVDRCVLYVFRCAVYYASNDDHDPELLKWWNWKDS